MANSNKNPYQPTRSELFTTLRNILDVPDNGKSFLLLKEAQAALEYIGLPYNGNSKTCFSSLPGFKKQNGDHLSIRVDNLRLLVSSLQAKQAETKVKRLSAAASDYFTEMYCQDNEDNSIGDLGDFPAPMPIVLQILRALPKQQEARVYSVSVENSKAGQVYIDIRYR